jgi:hypothetical protein
MLIELAVTEDGIVQETIVHAMPPFPPGSSVPLVPGSPDGNWKFNIEAVIGTEAPSKTTSASTLVKVELRTHSVGIEEELERTTTHLIVSPTLAVRDVAFLVSAILVVGIP